MTFDACEHQVRQVVIRAAKEIRKARGLPEESNITTLFNEIAPLLGVPSVNLSSAQIDHLPAPHEMVNEKGRFVVPRKDCPKCGIEENMILSSICGSCADAESGKFHSAWLCPTCQYKEKSGKFFTQWLTELGVEIPTGHKQDMGIKTLTDDGLR